MSRKLGDNQVALLKCLVDHGAWHDRAGWHWDGIGRTTTMLKALVARGLVTEEPVVPARKSVTDGKTPIMRYAINAAGRRALKPGSRL